MKHKGGTNPPGRRKIIEALTRLLRTKNFHSVTTAEIADMAGVTEGLIYKYFDSKNDLLYKVLSVHFTQFHHAVRKRIADRSSAIEKLEIIILASLESYIANRVFARMLLLEVRNSPDYFSSEAYTMVQTYARTILDIISEGVRKGELRSDTDPQVLRKVILGAIEHACLGEVIFSRQLDAKTMAERLSSIIFNGARA